MKISSLHRYVTMLMLGLSTVTWGCSHKSGDHQDSVQHQFTAPIEKAHKMNAWKKKSALKTNIRVTFGGQSSLDGNLTVQTDGPGIRLAISKDTVAVFDGKQMWVMPGDSALTPFQLKTWAYFLKAPYKLNDPGTHIAKICTVQKKGLSDATAKLSFDAGTGDSPDDWFILYRSNKTNRLDAMAYIVTYGKTVKQAEKQPHAITYEHYQQIDGIPIAMQWKFWTWNATEGFSDQSIGQAQLSDLHFVKDEGLFSKPDKAVKMKR